MDIGQAFTFISEDENWAKKLGIGALISSIPFLNFAALGYQVHISRNVVKGEERPLPEWNNWGDLFLDGLRIISAMFIYMLPMLLLYSLAFGIVFLSIDPAAINEYSGSGTPPVPAGFLAFMGIFLLCGMPYTLITWLLWPMLSIQVARTSKWTACFDFRSMWQLIRQDWVNYLLVIGFYLGLTMGMSFIVMPVVFVLILIPCLGFMAMILIQGAVMMLVQVVSGHIQGQFILHNDNPPFEKPQLGT